MNSELSYLNDLTWAYRASRVLQTAVKLKLFTHLENQPRSCDELASLCSAKPELLGKLLIACCAMKLLEVNDGVYANTELSQTYLIEGKPLYQGNIISHAERVWDYWAELPNDIFSTPPQETDDQPHRDFIFGMRDITAAPRGQIFLDHVDLTGRKKMFDVGGGPGLYSILACQKYPDLTATVFDLPETIAIARQFIDQENLTGRISVLEGSWDTDSFGAGNDVVLFSNVLHGPESDAAPKLQKAFDSLIPGGMVAIQEFALNDTKTGPLIPALFNVMVGAYAKNELMDLLAQIGYTDAKVVVESHEIGCTWITALKRTGV